MAPPHQIHDILFFGKKSGVAVTVAEADFGCEVDLKTKVSRKIKVDCQLYSAASEAAGYAFHKSVVITPPGFIL